MAFAWMFTSAIAMAVVSDPKVAIVVVITIMIHKKVGFILYDNIEPPLLYYWEVTYAYDSS